MHAGRRLGCLGRPRGSGGGGWHGHGKVGLLLRRTHPLARTVLLSGREDELAVRPRASPVSQPAANKAQSRSACGKEASSGYDKGSASVGPMGERVRGGRACRCVRALSSTCPALPAVRPSLVFQPAADKGQSRSDYRRRKTVIANQSFTQLARSKLVVGKRRLWGMFHRAVRPRADLVCISLLWTRNSQVSLQRRKPNPRRLSGFQPQSKLLESCQSPRYSSPFMVGFKCFSDGETGVWAERPE